MARVKAQLLRPALLRWAQRAIYPIMKASIQKLYAAGARIAFGVDVGTPNRFAGFNEHQELEYLVHASLAPMEALAAATSVSAEILGLDKRGTRY